MSSTIPTHRFLLHRMIECYSRRVNHSSSISSSIPRLMITNRHPPIYNPRSYDACARFKETFLSLLWFQTRADARRARGMRKIRTRRGKVLHSLIPTAVGRLSRASGRREESTAAAVASLIASYNSEARDAAERLF